MRDVYRTYLAFNKGANAARHGLGQEGERGLGQHVAACVTVAVAGHETRFSSRLRKAQQRCERHADGCHVVFSSLGKKIVDGVEGTSGYHKIERPGRVETDEPWMRHSHASGLYTSISDHTSQNTTCNLNPNIEQRNTALALTPQNGRGELYQTIHPTEHEHTLPTARQWDSMCNRPVPPSGSGLEVAVLA